MSLATLLAIGTALRPVAPMSGFIFFLEIKLYTLTAMIPPNIDIAKAINPPTMVLFPLSNYRITAYLPVAPTKAQTGQQS